jgi:exopolysaccharide biosynthesis polyprenyl glycosylphosphotransferase
MTPAGNSLPIAAERETLARRAAAPARAALTPAPKCAAILVPPLVVGLLAHAVLATLDVVVEGVAWPLAGARVALATLAALVAAGLVLCALHGRRSFVGTVAIFAVASGAASVVAVVLPGASPSALMIVACALVATWAPHLWRVWQDRWTRTRVERVSLLAASTIAAIDAVARLEVVPWVRVASVLVPDADVTAATALLGRPVAAAVRGGPRLERTVIVSSPLKDRALGGALAELVARGHDVTSESATLRTAEGRVDTSRADPLNLLLGRPRSRLLDASSRILDIVGALVLLLFASPVLLACALAVVVDDGFPVFYRQRRVGRGGRPFDVVKFRSMRNDAETLSGPVWASEADPRITRVGRFLRRYRLDELPQLWNVLVGEMALVGPRPERPHFCDVLREQVPLFELRTIARPGLTGWAQVRLAYGASADDARAKLEYDLFYVMHRSVWFDLAILAETAKVVLTGAGSR